MKKRFLWILFLTALLCLSMLFAACDSDVNDIEETSATETEQVTEAPTEAPTETPTEASTEEPETEARPVDVVVNHENAIDIWESYFSFVAKENDTNAFVSFTQLFNTAEQDVDGDGNEDTYTSVDSIGEFYVVTRRTTTNGYSRDSIAFYNARTGKKILSASERFDEDYKIYTYSYSYSFGEDWIIFYETSMVREETEDVTGWTEIRTSSCYDFNGNLLATVKTSDGESFEIKNIHNMFKEIAVETRVNMGTEEEPDWQDVKTYSYFDNEGKAWAKGLEEPARYGNWDYEWNYELNRAEYFGYINLEGKNYYFNAGEIIFVDENPQANRLPVEVEVSPYKIGEYKGFNYYLLGSRIQVVDTKTYKVVANYTVPEQYATYGDFEVEILANGNVYVFALMDGDDIFDSEYVYGGKYLRYNVIIDITTGQATEVDVPFVVINMLTPASTAENGISVKDECNYAEILAVKDGKISSEIEFVILNSKLEKIATLPKFVENQIGFEKMIGEGKFVVTAQNLWYEEAEYLADAKTNTVAPYWNGNYSYKIENGFVVVEEDAYGNLNRYVVYNYNLQKVAEYTSEQSPTFDTGVIRFYDTVTVGGSGDDPTANDAFINDYKPSTETETVYKVAYINANGELKTNEISRDKVVTKLGGLDLWTVSKEVFVYGEEITRLYVYNVYGECITSIDNATDIKIVNNQNGIVVGMAITEDGAIYYIIK
ncbi:MAG: hypothetical protein IKJ24_04290 [Clostridia bacterium]|nr:hypothetical protein [Clostridia bacterium]